MAQLLQLPSSQTEAANDVVRECVKHATAARNNRKPYEIQWMKNQMYAAGLQWLRYDEGNHRVLQQARDDRGRYLDTVDVLSQYRGTAIGKLAAGGDLRPELLLAYGNDEAAEEYAQQLNDAVDFAWNEECKGDKRLLAILRSLVELGTAAVRCRYDRNLGQLVGEFPHQDGRPILDKQAAGSYIEEQFNQNQPANIRPVREGAIRWEKLSAWNLLPPPGIEDPDEFPWEIIVRPVHLDELKAMYGSQAAGVTADKIEDMGMLSYAPAQRNDASSPATVSKLEDHALVYTRYRKPTARFPVGQTCVWSNDGHLLAEDKRLPYNDQPHGPRSGITYFRWDVLDGRFWARSFIEPALGAQKIRNKRLSQQDETIDRDLSKVFVSQPVPKLPKGFPMEVIVLGDGQPQPTVYKGQGPGTHFQADIELQDENIRQALGETGVGLGENPPNVQTYGQLALLTENGAVKLDPIAQGFRSGIADLVRDTVESMRQWPPGKQLLIAGEGNELREQAFDAKRSIPSAYLARAAKGGTLPRTQAAEVQKIGDIANYAQLIGAAAQNPAEWLRWYVDSLNAGKMEDLPESGAQEQLHKAALENVLMQHGTLPPVAPYDDPNVHIPEHDQAGMEAQTAAEYALQNGDQAEAQRLAQVNQIIERHKQLHLLMSQQNQAGTAPGAPGALPPGPPTVPAPAPVQQPPTSQGQ